MGFNEKKVAAAARLQPGDRLLCYLTKRSTFVAILEVTGPSYQDSKPIWTDGLFPVRLPVKVISELSPLAGLPVHLLLGKLSFLTGPAMPNNWTVHVRSSPRPWKAEDGMAVVQALQERIDRSTAPLAPDLPGQKIDTSLIESNRKRPKFGTDSRVGKLLGRADDLRGERATELMGGVKSILSFNKVTGHSVNFPISETCRPTAVCLKYCYFAKGPNSWPDSLSHQYTQLQRLTQSDSPNVWLGSATKRASIFYVGTVEAICSLKASPLSTTWPSFAQICQYGWSLALPILQRRLWIGQTSSSISAWTGVRWHVVNSF
jgi:hypothetical protein